MKNAWELLENVVKKIIGVALKICGITWTQAQWDTLFQFVKFGLVGAMNALVVYITYSLFVWLGTSYLLANFIAFVISVLNSFYWNNKYVFAQGEAGKRNVLHTLCKTFIAYSATGVVLNSVLLIVWIDVLHISQYIAPIINIIITTPLNFVVNKFWSYKTKQQKEEQ